MSKEIAVKDDPILKVFEDPKNAKLSPMKAVYAGVGLVVTKLSSFVIKKTEDYDSAMAALKEAKAVIEEVDKAYEKAAGDDEARVKRAKDAYKMITGPVNLGVADLKQKMGKFQNDQQARRDKEAEELRLKAAKEAEKLVTADSTKDQEKIGAKIDKIEAKAEAISTFKAKTADKVRKFEVVDPDKVERKYCTPEDKKIRPFIGEVNGPIPEIPGVGIWDEVKVVIR